MISSRIARQITIVLIAFLYGVLADHYNLFPVTEAQKALRYFRPAPPSTNPIAPVDVVKEQKRQLFKTFHPYADFVMLGDSITAWPDWRELFPDLNIANRGIAGDTTLDASKRLESIIAIHPRKVFIMLGVNDLLAYKQSQEDAFSRYSEIVRRLSAAGIAVVVQSTLFTSDTTANAKIAALNKMLSIYCEQTRLCTYIDLTTSISATDTFDGIHLTAHGYELWREAIAPEFAKPP